MPEKQTCSCCVMDESVPSITFDEDGVCNLCHVQDKLSRTFAIGEDKAKQATFDKMIQEIKEEGRGDADQVQLPDREHNYYHHHH